MLRIVCLLIFVTACAPAPEPAPSPQPERAKPLPSEAPALQPVAEPERDPTPNPAPDPTPDPDPTPSPTPPSSLVRYLTGSAADAKPTLGAGAVFLMGGGTDVDAAFAAIAARIPNADVVILRASGADGYNDYLYSDIGGFDSVETLLVTTRALANDAYVVSRVAEAELVFMAGGDQSVYLAQWAATKLAVAITAAHARGAIIGGTSAGAMVTGDPVFSAAKGSITSDEALADPFDAAMHLLPGPFSLSSRLIVETHFYERDRLGRLVAFLARAYVSVPVWGVGIDEKTALIVEADGRARTYGSGKVDLLYADHAPTQMSAGKPLTYRHVKRRTLAAGVDLAKLFDPSALDHEVDCVAGEIQ
ncbi:MAG: cyanophycinase [Deltaproteobacteria bacterium]|nr:cyanophycinase [Deltaproteobacteria bacterium]